MHHRFIRECPVPRLYRLPSVYTHEPVKENLKYWLGGLHCVVPCKRVVGIVNEKIRSVLARNMGNLLANGAPGAKLPEMHLFVFCLFLFAHLALLHSKLRQTVDLSVTTSGYPFPCLGNRDSDFSASSSDIPKSRIERNIIPNSVGSIQAPSSGFLSTHREKPS